MAKRNHAPPALQFLPMAIDLRGRDCVVIGGGAVGTRKAGTLARAGARVTVIAPTVTDELGALITAGVVRWIEGPFHESQVHGAMLVVAATNYQALNHTIVEQARRAGALACDASSSAGSQVIFG
ncbi:MAG: bifunctional precorrin-2 dehydrogenase/sirohydrochlorin ferrochelatase, partial [Gemmatimonadota bacterium]|nr:bifunctional precorrin-2 dehydrogenase/sirohydrochlorin ferrochelatase [Gemmatimonadota bacterium]